MSEAEIQARIRIALGRLPDVRLFRNNRGLFWTGRVVHRDATSVTLLMPRQMEAGLVDGASDLIGATRVTITPEMVGTRIAVFTAMEVKRPGVAGPAHQQRFVDFFADFGARAAVVRSAEDALRLVGRR